MSLRETDQSIQMERRDLRALKEGELADLSTSVAYHESRLAELEHFKSDTGERMLAAMASYDAEKVALVVAEITKIKSQVFFLQQTYLQMKSQEALRNETTVAAEPASQSDEAQVSGKIKRAESAHAWSLLPSFRIQRKDCLRCPGRLTRSAPTAWTGQSLRISKTDRSQVSTSSSRLVGLVRKWKKFSLGEMKFQSRMQLEEAERSVSSANAKVFALSQRLDEMEAEARKYNLVIRGLKQKQKLERPTHLETLVKGFFAERLGLADVAFDEARRNKADSSGTQLAIL